MRLLPVFCATSQVNPALFDVLLDGVLNGAENPSGEMCKLITSLHNTVL